MAENVINPDKKEKREKPFDRYEKDRALEALFPIIELLTQQHERRAFTTPVEAQNAGVEFTAQINALLESVGGFNMIDLEFSGDGLELLDIDIYNAATNVSQVGSLTVVKNDGHFRPAEPLEQLSGHIIGVMTQLSPEKSYVYRNICKYLVRNKDLFVRHIQGLDPAIPFALATINVSQISLARSNGNTTIETANLQKLQSKREIKNQLMVNGLGNSLFVRQLDKLQQALFRETEDEFRPLERIDLLHDVGRLGEQYSRKDPNISQIISRAVFHAIVQERAVKVFGKEVSYFRQEGVYIDTISDAPVVGEIIDVIMPQDPQDTEPLLAINDHLLNGKVQPRFFPITKIEELQF